jgi:hypothetical protein
MRYRYPTGRRAYGRPPGSYPLEDEASRCVPDYWRYRPYDRAEKVRAIPMPHGGYRYLYRCRLCGSWRTVLYNWMRVPGILVCRACMQLRYRSQYEGRRLEASPQRVAEAVRELEQVKPPQREHTRRRRARRIEQAGRIIRLRATDLDLRRHEYFMADLKRAVRRFARPRRRRAA